MGEMVAPNNRKGLPCENSEILLIGNGKIPFISHLVCYGFKNIRSVVTGEKYMPTCSFLHIETDKDDYEYCEKRRYEK